MNAQQSKSVAIPGEVVANSAVVEQVREASSLRVLLLEMEGIPVHQFVNLQISGIKAPIHRKDIPGVPDLIEPYAEQAKYFVESKLLHRKVHVLLESTNGQGQNVGFYGSIQHPAGNIAEVLLTEGYAKVLDWNLAVVKNATKYRACEQIAKAKKLRLWHDYIKTDKSSTKTDFQAIVTKILGGDLIVVEALENPGIERKIGLASIKGPKRSKNGNDIEVGYYADAFEYLRSKLIRSKVNVKIDYVKCGEGDYEQRECATVTKGTFNIAEGLLSKGLATVIKHRKDDINRSSAYDKLLQAEERAIEGGKGLHSTKEPPTHRIVDASENLTKAKSYFSQLQRVGTMKGIVEYVASGSRFKIYLSSQNCRLTFVLSGVKTPRVSRQGDQKSEPFGPEAAMYSTRAVFQQEVEISVESQDKMGGFIGTLYFHDSKERLNLAVMLLQEGLSTIHEYSASTSPHGNLLSQAEFKAKKAKKNIWKSYDEEVERVQKETEKLQLSSKGPVAYEVVISEVSADGHLYMQIMGSELTMLEKMMSDFAKYHASYGQQAIAPFTPRAGEYCSAQFSVDKQWYRAKVRKVNGINAYAIIFIDYGNAETVPGSRIRPLPLQYSVSVIKPQAVEAKLAYLELPAPDSEYAADAISELCLLTEGASFVANVVGTAVETAGPLYSVILYNKNASVAFMSVNECLIREGLATVTSSLIKKHQLEQRAQQKNMAVLMRHQNHKVKSDLERFIDAQDETKKTRVGMWQYGDFTPDEDL